MTQALRVVTLNIHKGLSQFNRRMVIHELREGLNSLEPDLVFLQEVQGLNERHALRFGSWPSAPQHEYLKQDGWEYAYGLNRVHHYGHYGNAVLSRFPIVSIENADISSHRFERRGLLHCVLSVPGWRRDLHCLCVHLSLHERGRRRQLDAIVERLGHVAARCSRERLIEFVQRAGHGLPVAWPAGALEQQHVERGGVDHDQHRDRQLCAHADPGRDSPGSASACPGSMNTAKNGRPRPAQ